MEIHWAIWIFMFGACVGSFLNVVVWRLPRGQSICYPGSYCPACGRAIAGHDNIPIFSWFFLAGKCRFCRSAISIRYPIVEFTTAAVVTLLYVCYYILNLRRGAGDFSTSWPMFVAYAVLLCGLLACSLIDVEHWLVPLEVCWVVSAIGAASATIWPHPFMPPVGGHVSAAAVAATIGLAIALLLQRWRILLPSFIDAGGRPFRPRRRYMLPGDSRLENSDPGKATSAPAEDKTADQQTGIVGEQNSSASAQPPPDGQAGPSDATSAAGDKPADAQDTNKDASTTQPARVPSRTNLSAYKVAATEACGISPRLEIFREVLFLLPAALLAVAAWCAFDRFPDIARLWNDYASPFARWAPASHVNALLASLTGFLIGGLWIWAIRILGTLLFNKEAMGLGDVHVMAAVGAVTGWIVPSMVFFLAPVLGLAWALFMWFSRGRRELPYGPWLAAATLAILIFYDRVMQFLKDYTFSFVFFRPG
ncbi:MAG: prepilin peptidase [Planctomycetes bacterium]|nr:prepilin peptidase [Planctomycetota bacterium]